LLPIESRPVNAPTNEYREGHHEEGDLPSAHRFQLVFFEGKKSGAMFDEKKTRTKG